MDPSQDFFWQSGNSDSGSDDAWIQWFCRQKGNEFFCEVDPSYIDDPFNLTGLSACVPHYSTALDILLDCATQTIEGYDDDTAAELNEAATLLYGLIHARFILTGAGLTAMKAKYETRDFGTCTCYFCDNQPLLPIALSDSVGRDSVKLYCASCKDIYKPKQARFRQIDGAFFTTSFPHMFYLQFPHYLPSTEIPQYQPKIFGFRIREHYDSKDSTEDEVVPPSKHLLTH
ncbi:hypothetical protein RCL1_002853 [Eukaryota sp. TZLM3-RCL]